MTNEKPKKPPLLFFAHFKSGKDPKHRVGEAIKTFFTHFKSNMSKKHSIKEDASEDGYSSDHLRTVKEQHKHIPVTKDQKSSLADYTDESHQLNNRLHSGREHEVDADEDLHRMKNHLDAITNHRENKLQHPIKTYSGVGQSFGKVLNNLKNGDHIKSPAFISSSTRKKVAVDHASSSFTKKDEKEHLHKHVIVFHLPEGHTKARSIKHLSVFPDEEEVIHARNQTFKKIGYSHEEHPLTPRTTKHIHFHHVTPVEDQ